MKPTTLDEAIAFLARRIMPLSATATVHVAQAVGYILAEDIHAPASLPRFDNSAMDGYALKQSDIDDEGIAKLSIDHVIAAGCSSGFELRSGSAARIMTGAPVPVGADRVVMQENAVIDGSAVTLRITDNSKFHIRRVGEDVREGQQILKAGTKLHPGNLSLLVGLGFRSVRVTVRPRVAILSTGNELADSPDKLVLGQIYDTNRPMLSWMLAQAGADVTDLGIIRDDPSSILSALASAAKTHDLLITSGGASEGFADHLSDVVTRHGSLEFWKLNMRPGKPIGFGEIEHCPVLVLPGNPVAAAAGFATLGRAIIQGLVCRSCATPSYIALPLSVGYSKPAERVQLLMGKFRRRQHDNAIIVEPLTLQSSSSYRALSEAEVFILLGAGKTTVSAGDLVAVVPLWQHWEDLLGDAKLLPS
ncbi:molybdopterin molybdotransferase MoeA [Aliirhizobium cellulosilyticum]|uniref:Molybdopterin molybdenumtransferase n=1 Tax=Aliirhizobium cellulosilyticum TaxID=393664 RepID=A0A7W6TFK3_9HYPH|nr:gephyrin-like molybdotransferase Glp [Rhizobium cellulosilyticum]MBB4349421.1 molybdopterin molybdotransferase [Rhizobium cellulosilyticum]MBB4412357.1 molybdopterin molybdotransferase [Rhizobium cellulosilyticum]MBB4446989.1 molybdopterin molybdotransferase [Rhizobium cellulosilyticum]